MIPEIYWIPEVTTGRLGIMARPRAGEWLRDEVSGWCRLGVRAVVCLLEPSEVRELDLQDEPILCEGSKIEFISFPVSDRGVPKSMLETVRLVEQIVHFLKDGASVVVHCRAGIGRSSLIAACVMLKLGFPSNQVFPILRQARGLPVPDSPEQERWLSTFGATGLRPEPGSGSVPEPG